MNLPQAESPDELYEPNATARKQQRALWLAVAAVLGVIGLVYVWAQLSPTSHRTVDETKRRVLATAEIARNPDPPEVVNSDLQRQVQQLQQQNQDLQTQNLQLADAAKQAQGARNADRSDAMRTISVLEDEVNRKRGGASAGPATSPPSAPSANPSLAGAAPAPPLAAVPASLAPPTSGGGPEALDAGPAERPRRTMSVIRTSLVSRPDAKADDSVRASQGGGLPPPEFANRKPEQLPGAPAAAGSAGPGPGKVTAAYFTSRLERYSTADYVPPNAYASAEVLVGVDSATNVNAASDPKPVLLRLTGDATSVGADGRYQRTRIKGCLVNGAAYGELSSEKVYVKLQRITCPAGDKSFSVATVEGYVSQRGKAGVRGVVVERAGGLTARAAVAGTLQGLGTTLSQNLQRSAGGVNAVAGPGGLLGAQKLSGSELAEGAVGGGVSNAASQLAEYYIRRAEQYQPVIEMPTGIEVEIVFLSGFQIRGGQ